MRIDKDVIKRLANRHIAKLLCNIEEVVDLPELAKKACRAELHYLADDIMRAVREGGDYWDGEGNE